VRTKSRHSARRWGSIKLAGTAPPPASAVESVTKPPHPKPKPGQYEVETILGNKQVVRSFVIEARMSIAMNGVWKATYRALVPVCCAASSRRKQQPQQPATAVRAAPSVAALRVATLPDAAAALTSSRNLRASRCTSCGAVAFRQGPLAG